MTTTLVADRMAAGATTETRLATEPPARTLTAGRRGGQEKKQTQQGRQEDLAHRRLPQRPECGSEMERVSSEGTQFECRLP